MDGEVWSWKIPMFFFFFSGVWEIGFGRVSN